MKTYLVEKWEEIKPRVKNIFPWIGPTVTTTVIFGFTVYVIFLARTGRLTEETIVNPWLVRAIDIALSTHMMLPALGAAIFGALVAWDFVKYPKTRFAFRALYQFALSLIAGRFILYGATFLSWNLASHYSELFERYPKGEFIGVLSFALGIGIIWGGTYFAYYWLKKKIKSRFPRNKALSLPRPAVNVPKITTTNGSSNSKSGSNPADTQLNLERQAATLQADEQLRHTCGERNQYKERE